MMRLAIYAVVLSAIYAIIAVVNDRIAQALTVLFVAAIVVPALAAEFTHRGHRDG